MRVQRLLDEGADVRKQEQFAKWLLSVGDGSAGQIIPLPLEIVVEGYDMDSLITAIYGDLDQPANRLPASLLQRCIVAPKNVDIRELNANVHRKWPGVEMSYTSADQVILRFVV